MEGTITITSSDLPSNISNNVNGTQTNIDTMAVLMVPTEDVEEHSENSVKIMSIYLINIHSKTSGKLEVEGIIRLYLC
ncbi:MAG: hypothetical protein ABR515_04275 [Nitrososphaeraceae archaeon]